MPDRTPWTPPPSPDTDAIEHVSAGTREAVILAFQNDWSVDHVLVRPQQLLPQAEYEVSSVDTGVLGVATGADIMSEGTEVRSSPSSGAHLLVLRVKP